MNSCLLRTFLTLHILLWSPTLWPAGEFGITTFNIRNFNATFTDRARTDLPLLKSILKETAGDLIMAQEIFDHLGLEKFIQLNWPSHRVIFSDCGGFSDQKLAFIYNSERLELLSMWEEDSIGLNKTCITGLRPAFVAIFKERSTGESLVAINVHLKSGGPSASLTTRARQLEALKDFVLSLRGGGKFHYAIGGDFNSVGHNTKGEDYQLLEAFAREGLLVQVTKDQGCSYYWKNAKASGRRSKRIQPNTLDHLFVSPSLLEKFNHSQLITHSHCQTLKCAEATHQQLGRTYNLVSDHCPIEILLTE